MRRAGRIRGRLADALGWSTEPVDVRVSAALLLAACLLYLPGIGWGLPLGIGPAWTDGWSPDEIAPLGFADLWQALFSDAPRYSPQYPMFHYYVQTIVCAPVVIFLWLAGGIGQVSGEWPYGLADPPAALRALTVAGRVPSVLMGAGTVVAAYQVGRETWGRRAGLLGALGAMLVAPLVFYSRTANVDVPALFWTALGLSTFVACATRGVTLGRGVAFGLLAALALGTKDTCYAPFVGMALALPFLPEPGTGEPREWWRIPEGRLPSLAIGAVVGLAAYAVTSGLAIHPERYVHHVRFLTHGPLDGYWAGTPGPEELAGTTGRSAARLAGTMGWPLAALAVVGVGLARWRSPLSLILLLPAAAAVAGVVLPSRFVFPRFFLFPAVVAALYAGYALDRLLASRPAAVRWLGVAAAVGALGLALARDVELTYAMFDETREEAATWLARHARPGDCVAHTFWISKLPRLPDGVRTLEIPWDRDPLPVVAEARPEFVVEVAASPGEEEVEMLLRPWLRRWLTATGGYELALDLPYPGKLAGRLVPWVAPPVRVWARRGPPAEDSPWRCVDPRGS